MLSLTQKSYEQYNDNIKDNGILIIDSSVNVNNSSNNKIFSIPILDSATKVLGKPMVTNIVAIGALVAITKAVTKEALMSAVLNRVPKGTEDLNKKALELGYEIAERAIK